MSVRRFGVRSVLWRQVLRWGVMNVPMWLEPIILGWWAALFMAVWTGGRRGVMRNLSSILPGSRGVTNLLRTYAVFWNFGWTITDNVRFKEQRVVPDLEFVGLEHIDALQSLPGGAIILTAHMGSYDLGAQLFAENSNRKVVMVRAPEVDPATQAFEETQRKAGVKIDFNTKTSELALELLHAVQHGEIIAIQGDRVTPGIATLPATLFGKPTSVPAGPFALAMAARVPIFPLFIVRLGRRHYRLLACEPIEVVRRGRNRDEDFAIAVGQWTQRLESVIGSAWWQWFAFEPFAEERAA